MLRYRHVIFKQRLEFSLRNMFELHILFLEICLVVVTGRAVNMEAKQLEHM